MKKKHVNEPAPYKFNLSQRAAILLLLEKIGDDGHTVYREEILHDFPLELVNRFARKFESDGTAKGTLFDAQGKPLPIVRGVYGLEVLCAMAQDFGVTYYQPMGRGFHARNATAALKAFFEANK